jgi:hypothetical protein
VPTPPPQIRPSDPSGPRPADPQPHRLHRELARAGLEAHYSSAVPRAQGAIARLDLGLALIATDLAPRVEAHALGRLLGQLHARRHPHSGN